MKKCLLLLSIAAALPLPVGAEALAPGNAVRMEFSTIPGAIATKLEHRVTPYRIFDKMVVTIEDPVYCGQEASKPSFSIEGNSLHLGYELSATWQMEKNCMLVSQFTVFNVPHRDLEVHFAGGHEPYAVARLSRCPNYAPKSGDVWECLVPEASLQ